MKRIDLLRIWFRKVGQCIYIYIYIYIYICNAKEDCVTNIFAPYLSFIYIYIYTYILIDLTTKSYTSSTPVESYKVSHMFCIWIFQTHSLRIWSGYIYIYHHHVVLVARISLTLSRHFSLSFIASGRSSGQHPVSSHSCWMYVRAGRPAFARSCVGVHKSTSLMSSSLFLQQCPACLVRLTWIVFVIGGRWPNSWCLVGCCRQDLFKIARSILV